MFVTAHDVGTLTSSHGPPWGQMEGAKMEGTLPECRRVERLSLMSSHRGQAELAVSTEPRSAQVGLIFHYRIVWLTNRLEGVL